MLVAKNISFSYLDESTLQNISFSVKKGTHLAIIGESGCGKSTLLKLIYGLYDLDEGQIFWKHTEVLGPKFHLIPGMPFMKYLAQDFDLMPFITVAENVGKYLSNVFKEEKKKRIAELLEIVEMTEYANVKAKKRVDELYNKHKAKWDAILPNGKKYMLSYAANHNRGALFIDLKNEQQARERLHRFGQRRAYDVSKLAIVRDIEPDSFGLEYSLLENLIARPFNTPVNELLMGSADSGSQNKGGFLAALKQRFVG